MTLSEQKFKRLKLQLQAKKRQAEQPTFFGDLQKIGQKRGEQFFAASDPGLSSNVRGRRATGAVLGGAFDVLRAGAGAAFRALPDVVEEPLRAGGEKAIETAMKIPGVGGKNLGESIQSLSQDLERLKRDKPELGRDIDAILGVTSFAAGATGASQTLGTTQKVLSATQRGLATKFDDVISGIASKTKGLQKVGTGVKEQFLEKSRQAKGATKRIEINTAERQAVRQAYEELDDVSKNAVQQGLLPRDVNLINSATPDEKKLFQQLKETASKFADDRTSTPPSQLLGNEWSKRLTSLDKQVGTKGQELGQFVKDIPARQLPNTMSNVMSELNKIPGLRGLTVDSKGVLNFSNTTLSSSISATERKIIQQIFNDIRGRGGKGLHQLRQELFEELGGRKASGLKLTGTEEQAINAMRKGMSNTLDEASDGYKALNQEFAKLAELKREIRKVFGEVSEGNEDIFNMKASIMLRRLTNNAKSGQDIAELIRETEKALGGFGVEFGTDITKIQEFMNMLNRYYDIAGDTSMLGILRTADVPLSKKGLVDDIINSVFEGASVTDETAKNAIRELLSN